jgi:AraC-like DNA-binding protein
VSVDVLSAVLRSVHLRGAAYFDLELTSPWVAEAPPAREVAPRVMPGAQRVIEYHLVARGECWGNAIGDDPVRLGEGDLILFPQGDAHVLSSAPGMRAAPDVSIYARRSSRLPIVHEIGGRGPGRARVICCFLGCDERPYNPLLGSLPRVIVHRADRVPAADARLRTLVEMALEEASRRRTGGENVLDRISELMFVEAVRLHLESLPAAGTGWLAGLRDPVVGPALGALHEEPALPWTIEGLARKVGASRSVLADRFSEIVGQPPMLYLALWRMQLAARQLAEGGRIAEVAAAVGYDSEAAFGRAFKRLVGVSPGAWRRAKGEPPPLRAAAPAVTTPPCE